MALSLDTPVLELPQHGLARLGPQTARRLALAVATVSGARGARFVAFGRWEWDARRNTFALRLNKPDELEMLPGTFTPPENALIRLAEQGQTPDGSNGADFDAGDEDKKAGDARASGASGD